MYNNYSLNPMNQERIVEKFDSLLNYLAEWIEIDLQVAHL